MSDTNEQKSITWAEAALKALQELSEALRENNRLENENRQLREKLEEFQRMLDEDDFVDEDRFR